MTVTVPELLAGGRRRRGGVRENGGAEKKGLARRKTRKRAGEK